ncbi:MAG: hypothetical protein HY040_18510 [Planctomycetes bacterium]|nr:hypothetical protein [Planctomycetota bacterium]
MLCEVIPTGAVASSETERLTNAVRSRLYGRIREFRLTFQQHGLVLQGHARTYYAKQLAQHAIMQATELPIAANDIEVRAPERAYP